MSNETLTNYAPDAHKQNEQNTLYGRIWVDYVRVQNESISPDWGTNGRCPAFEKNNRLSLSAKSAPARSFNDVQVNANEIVLDTGPQLSQRRRDRSKANLVFIALDEPFELMQPRKTCHDLLAGARLIRDPHRNSGDLILSVRVRIICARLCE